MNKVTYQKTKYYTLFGKTLFKTTEIYTEYVKFDVPDNDLPPIEVKQDYYNREFNNADNNNK